MDRQLQALGDATRFFEYLRLPEGYLGLPSLCGIVEPLDYKSFGFSYLVNGKLNSIEISLTEEQLPKPKRSWFQLRRRSLPRIIIQAFTTLSSWLRARPATQEKMPMERLKRVNGQDFLRTTPSFCLKKPRGTQRKRIGLWKETRI